MNLMLRRLGRASKIAAVIRYGKMYILTPFELYYKYTLVLGLKYKIRD